MGRAGGLTAWFDEYENDVNPMIWPSQSPDLKPIEHLQEILVQRVRQRSPPQPPTTNKGLSFGRMLFIPTLELNKLGRSMIRSTEAVLEALSGPTPHYDTY